MTDNHNANQDANIIRDTVPECRSIPQCPLLIEPLGCDSCDYKNPDLLCDEDGEPLHISGHPNINFQAPLERRSERPLLHHPNASCRSSFPRSNYPSDRRLCVGDPGFNREQQAPARRGKVLGVRRRGEVVNTARKRAARLAIYLECAGLRPVVQGATYSEYCASLEKQYCTLELEVRRSARIEGRRRIRQQGVRATASRLIPVPTGVCDLTKLNPEQRRRVRAAYRKKLRQRFPEILPCHKCRIAPGMPKRSWRSRELAEAARARQNDPGLQVYPCPAQPGFWHLGHRR